MQRTIVVILGDGWLEEPHRADITVYVFADDQVAPDVYRLPQGVALLPFNRLSDDRIIWLVPGGCVSACSLAVPAGFATKHLRSVPFLLEDQLIEDPASQHIAFRVADGLLESYVIAKPLMDSLLANAQQLDLPPHYLFSSLDVLSDNNAVLLETCRWLYFKWGTQQLQLPSTQHVFFHAEVLNAQLKSLLYVSSQGFIEKSIYEKEGHPISFEIIADEDVGLYQARCALENFENSVNLLQGEYRPHSAGERDKVLLGGMSIVAVIMLFIGFYLTILGGQINVQAEQTREATYKEASKYFPSLKRNQNIKKLVAERLNRTQEVALPITFSEIFDRFVLAWEKSDLGEAQLKSLEFSSKNQRLLVEIVGVDIAKSDVLDRAVQGQGLVAEMQSISSPGGEGASVLRLQISRGQGESLAIQGAVR